MRVDSFESRLQVVDVGFYHFEWTNFAIVSHFYFFSFNLKRRQYLVDAYLQKQQERKRDPNIPPRPILDPDCLRWTPLVVSNSFSDEVINRLLIYVRILYSNYFAIRFL